MLLRIGLYSAIGDRYFDLPRAVSFKYIDLLCSSAVQ